MTSNLSKTISFILTLTSHHNHIPIIRIIWRIIIPQLLHNIMQCIMLPADQDIPRTIVVIHHIRDAILVVSITARVD